MIRAEEIYDAATDDGAFDRLASTLAEAIGARSAAFHWGRSPADADEVSYSGYFSEEQMDVYDRDFAFDDVWGGALQGRSVNHIWNFADLVGDDEYEASRIYNEWIRPMGDDTFRCLGGTIRHGSTTGYIGFHRGRTQRPFSKRDVGIAQQCVAHIGRVMHIRRQLDRATHRGRMLHATLDLVGHATLILSMDGRLLHCNGQADIMLRRQDALMMRQQRIVARDLASDAALQAALRAAAAPEGTRSAAVMLRREDGPGYIVTVAALMIAGTRRIVLIATDPTTMDGSLVGRIRSLYGLTRAEVEVVLALCAGKAPEELARERGVALNTVRTQMKNIYSKMDCSRQSELVARISLLPRLNVAEI